MDCSSDSWETASIDSINITFTNKQLYKQKESNKLIKMKILHKILLIFELLRKNRDITIYKNLNEYEKIKLFKAKILQINVEEAIELDNPIFICDTVNFPGLFQNNTSYITQCDSIEKEIVFFFTLNLNHIPSRIYFTLAPNEEIKVFHEFILNGALVENKTKYNGNCFSVSFNGKISDQSVAFSKNCSYNKFYLRIINYLQEKFLNSNTISDQANKIFYNADCRRLKAIPTSISKIKNHPLYVMESLLSFNEFIYPKRPIAGYLKGDPVYLRNNVKKLRSQSGWLRQGKCFKESNTIPYRIVKGKKLYAEFQVKDVEILDITGKLMEAFHPNLTPKNAVYIDYDSEICKELGIEFSDCLVGFKGKEMVIKGFLCKKSDCYLVNLFIKQKEYYKKIAEEVHKYETAFQEWKLLIKKTKKYLNISQRIGNL